MPADRRGAWLAVDSGGRCFRVRARMPADRRGAWLPLMVVGAGVLAGSPDLRTHALSPCDGRGGPNTPPRHPVI